MSDPKPSSALAVLTEDEVIDAVQSFLVDRSWRIVRRATAVQRGDDLVAERDGQRLVIEAKGAGSSKVGTARYGKTFNKGQVFDHVGKAVLKALRVVSASEDRAGIALPGDAAHRAEVEKIQRALDRVASPCSGSTRAGPLRSIRPGSHDRARPPACAARR